MDKLIKAAAAKLSGAKHPVSFSGAGLSAESGIATFRDRTDSDALWSKFDPMQIASQEGFAADPEMVMDWYNWRRKTLAEALPNQAHMVLGNCGGWVHITQNVDNLLEAGGANHEDVLHLHGTLLEDRCNANCGYTETVELEKAKGLRPCPDCGEYIRPSVVWFGENLSETVLQSAMQAASAADVLLVVGTSAQVYPAAGLIEVARRHGADIVVVNTEISDDLSAGDIEIIGQAGVVLPQLLD